MTTAEKQNWFALEVTAEPEAAEAIEHALNELDALGTEINLMPRTPDDTVAVIGYFNSLPEDGALQDELHHALRIYDLDENAIRTVERREVEDQDWLLEWKKHWKPTTIGKFVIAPPWEDIVHDDHKIVIRIEPNMAFGTGTHETTQLCLKAIDENYPVGQSFLDVGTGTGILAIAAAKLADKKANILAVDTDADSIKIATENADTNGVGDMINFHVGPITSESPAFDFVCANLTLDVILPILDLLLEKALGTLILSGILQEQEDLIVTALKGAGLRGFSVERSGEWIAVTIKKN
jgi:ribosomal protein L11 methyltransferase